MSTAISSGMLGDVCGIGRARSLLLDLGERGLVLALYVWLIARMVADFAAGGGWESFLLLPAEGLVVLFMVIRRTTTQVSRRPIDWVLALAATASPLLVETGSAGGLVPAELGMPLLLMGTIVQLHAKITLGRSFGAVAANRGVKCAGPYRHVRHPMYAGYFLGHVGFLAIHPSWWNIGVYALCYVAQVPRLLAEERLLGEDPRYAAYMQRVRYRLLPGVF